MGGAACLVPFFPNGRALAQAAPDAATIADAWQYLIARALVVRQEMRYRAEKGFAFNAVTYNPLGSANFVNPNFDVAYLEGWIAVDGNSHTVLEVPKVEGRYYTVQILDEWGEVIANINERTFPSKPHGRFALVAPGSTPDLPEDMGRIELHSAKAKLLGRVELKTDPEAAVALQRAFTLTPSGTPVIADPPPLPMFDNAALIGAALFDHAEALIASAADISPLAAEMQQKARAVAALADRIPQFQNDAITKLGSTRNHWAGGARTGNYGADYFTRAAVNYAGIWANVTDEVIYFGVVQDANGAPLDGGRSYVIHFPADQLPDTVVEAYWSVILVGVPDYMVVANPLGRYNFNSYSGLAKEPDGSLRIAIGPAPVAGVPESNWLPSVAGKPFSLTFRTYVPTQVVREGRWYPPPVTPVE